jgi:hypothetical protein
MINSYQEIYAGEIFQKSQCIQHENTLMDFLRSNLRLLGYHTTDPDKKIWSQGHRRVVICLVDDIFTCGQNKSADTPYLNDKNTTVITDNYVACPTQYQVCQLPTSFFGIYYYRPEQTNFDPVKRVGLSVNRIDPTRLRILLELVKRSSHNPEILANEFVNFNCWHHSTQSLAPLDLQQNFVKCYKVFRQDIATYYGDQFDLVMPHMPMNNHHRDVEHLHLSSFVNMIVETYSGQNTVAISEKIFRALVTPAPWTVYAGKYTVAYLKSLGFDVLDDLINHGYDQLELDSIDQGKIVEFVWSSISAADRLKNLPREQLVNRCQQAATHNQAQLARMQQMWPPDFAAWWPTVVEKIK